MSSSNDDIDARIAAAEANLAAADDDERLPAGDRAGAGERIERGDGELRLGEGQPRLSAEPGVPPWRRRVEPPRLLVEREE